MYNLIQFEIYQKGKESFHDHMLVYVANLVEVVSVAWLEDVRGVMLQDFLEVFQSGIAILTY